MRFKAWPHLWPSTASDYVESVWVRAPESSDFRYKSIKNHSKTLILQGFYGSGRRSRKFESCHLDQNRLWEQSQSPFSLSSAPQILRADRASVSPLLRLCGFHFCLLGCYLRFLLGNHFGKCFLTLLSRLCVYVEFLSVAIGESWIEASFPQAVIDLIYASRAGLARYRLPMVMWGLRAQSTISPWAKPVVHTCPSSRE